MRIRRVTVVLTRNFVTGRILLRPSEEQGRRNGLAKCDLHNTTLSKKSLSEFEGEK
jgi:hypothetical protein